jgi:ParB family chromosome partitioning protein
MKPKSLGKSLSSLIPDSYINDLNREKAELPAGLEVVELSRIRSNPEQPREIFNQEALQDLAESIREKGILQPLIVKRSGDGFEIVCGERRYRAARELGLEKVPVVIRDVADGELLELALIENIQREDLNAIEEAKGYLRLLEERGLSQEEISKRVGKNRATVANSLRLLRLPADILNLIQEGRITSGHARAVLGLPTHDYQRKMTRRIVEEELSVRQVEDIVARGNAGKRRAKRTRKLIPEILDLETRLAQKLGTQVRIYARGTQGRVEIKYFSLDDLDRVLDLLQVSRD